MQWLKSSFFLPGPFYITHPGETQVLAQILNSSGADDAHNGLVGVLASSHQPEIPGGPDSWQAALLVYSSDDNRTSTSTNDVTVSLKGLEPHAGGSRAYGYSVRELLSDFYMCK